MRELSFRVELEEKQLATLEQEHQLAVQESSKNLTWLPPRPVAQNSPAHTLVPSPGTVLVG